MNCPSCGEEISGDSVYCNLCGAKIEEFKNTKSNTRDEDEQVDGTDTQRDGQFDKLRSLWIPNIIGTLLLILGVIFLFSVPISGILYILAGLLSLPKIRLILKENRDFSLDRLDTIAVVFVVVVAGTVAIGIGNTNPEPGSDGDEIIATDSTPMDTDEPTPEPTPEPIEIGEEQPRELTNQEWQLAFRLTLNDLGYEVESVERVGKEIELDYYSSARSQEELAEEMGGIAGAYAGGVDGGWENEVLYVFILDQNGEIVASYWIEADWAQAWMDGIYDDEEFFGRILRTFEAS